MDETQAASGLYIPAAIEREGGSQPISTALSLDAGKNLCLNHFLKRCRTIKQRLPPGQGAEVAAVRLETLSLAWSQSPIGIYEGQPEENLVAALTGVTYQLRPAG